MQQQLDAATAAWRQARDAYESALRDDGDLDDEAKQALFDAEQDVIAAQDALTRRLSEFSQLLGALNAALGARTEILEQAAVEAEREAKHYDLAEKGYAEREKIGEVEMLQEALRDLGRDLDTVRRTFEELAI